MPSIIRAHVQTINTFAVPELLLDRHGLITRQSWMEFIQRQQIGKGEFSRGGVRFGPLPLPRRRKKPYEDRFWDVFRHNVPDSPRNVPLFFSLKCPTVSSAGIPGVSHRTVAMDGHLYPYGSAAVTLREYVRFDPPTNEIGLVDFLESDLPTTDGTRTRSGLLGKAKETVLDALHLPSRGLARESFPYLVIHVDTTAPVRKHEDWNTIRRLLAVSNRDQHLSRYHEKDFVNLGKPGQLILSSGFATVAFTPNLWTRERREGRNCLRDRLRATAELAASQRQVSAAFAEELRMVMSNLQYDSKFPWATFKDWAFPKVGHPILRDLAEILRLGDALNGSPRSEAKGWVNWLESASRAIFPSRVEALNRVTELLERLATAGEEARKDVVSSIDVVISLLQAAKGAKNG